MTKVDMNGAEKRTHRVGLTKKTRLSERSYGHSRESNSQGNEIRTASEDTSNSHQNLDKMDGLMSRVTAQIQRGPQFESVATNPNHGQVYTRNES